MVKVAVVRRVIVQNVVAANVVMLMDEAVVIVMGVRVAVTAVPVEVLARVVIHIAAAPVVLVGLAVAVPNKVLVKVVV